MLALLAAYFPCAGTFPHFSQTKFNYALWFGTLELLLSSQNIFQECKQFEPAITKCLMRAQDENYARKMVVNSCMSQTVEWHKKKMKLKLSENEGGKKAPPVLYAIRIVKYIVN